MIQKIVDLDLKKMPKVSSTKKTGKAVEIPESIVEAEDSMPGDSYATLMLSNHSHSDENNMPLCPDCDEELPMKLVSGIYLCSATPRHSQYAIAKAAHDLVVKSDIIPENFVFPVCHNCSSCMLTTPKAPKAHLKGMLYFTCRCTPGNTLWLTGKNKKADQILEFFSDEYRQKEFNPPKPKHSSKPYEKNV
jgi:hypothetical protein